MENNLKNYWNEIHNNYTSSYDGWLNKYIYLFDDNFSFVELGCGRAYCSKYLLDRGFSNITACDFSEEALNFVNKEAPLIETMAFDMSHGLPFKTNSKNVIIADLCLHYFDYKTTRFIFKEIYRVLKSDGYLLARVNSINDSFQLSKTIKKIEENFYYNGRIYKRFFSKQNLIDLSKDFEIYNIEENKMYRYAKNKVIWEICMKKI